MMIARRFGICIHLQKPDFFPPHTASQTTDSAILPEVSYDGCIFLWGGLCFSRLLPLYAVLLHVILLQSSLGVFLQDWHLDHNSGVLYPAGAFCLVVGNTGVAYVAYPLFWFFGEIPNIFVR